MDINITINTGETPEVKVEADKQGIKRRKRRLKNGGIENIVELPNTTETLDKRNILDLMGV